jgi:hypothetical protein
MDWDWDADPTYESERIRIDARLAPLVFFDMKLPRQLADREIDLMLSVADFHLEGQRPFLGLVRHERGTGVVVARHRKRFSDWIDERLERLERDDFSAVVVVPEAIFRAVLRVVYRFRAPPLRTITTPDMPGAIAATRSELKRMGYPPTAELESLLDALGPNGGSLSSA